MNTLTDEQRQQVSKWIQEGVKLSEIQNRIASEFGLRMTYMDVRFLVDDLKLTPKDEERPKDPALTALKAEKPSAPAGTPVPDAPGAAAVPQPAGMGRVTVTVDQLARPGAMVSGKVTFSDGQKADWYFDQSGRLGLAAQQPGYRPPPADLQEFQVALESELSRMGF